jgi:TPP-dependent pyruvate/acetoin dehydrogenase alpha subunit
VVMSEALEPTKDPLHLLQKELERAEAADDEGRLEVLEKLHATLEAELDEAGSTRP